MSVVTKESNPKLYNALFPDNEIKEILIKDFNEILVKEFCSDWKEKRLYIELLVNSTPFNNLLDYITNLQQENESLKEAQKNFEKQFIKEMDCKSRIEKIGKYIKEHTTSFGDVFIPASESWYLSDTLNGRSDE